MKEEEKYLEKLFQTAREEDSHLSFEEVSETFLESVPPTLFGNFKDWFFQNISLNSIIALGAGTFAITLLLISTASPLNTKPKEISSTNVTTSEVPSSSFQTTEKESNKLAQVIEQTELKASNSDYSSKNDSQNKITKQTKPPVNQSLTHTALNYSKRKRIPHSPKLNVYSKEKNVFSIKKEEPLKIDNNLITKKRKRILIPKKAKPSSRSYSSSPWVVGEGKTNPDWTFSHNQEFFERRKNSKILQKFFNNKSLEKVFEKDEQGNYLPLTIVADYNFSEYNLITFQNRVMDIVQVPLFDDPVKKKQYIYISKYKKRKNKAILKFNYQDYKVSIQLKKVNRTWQYHKLKIKNSTGTDIDVTF